MEDKPQKNSDLGKKQPTMKDDSAQENTLVSEMIPLDLVKTNLENIIKFYYLQSFKLLVALTKDYIKENQPKLFYGQIGEVVFLPDNETCWVKFYHYKNQNKNQEPKLIHQLQLPIVDLFPLFFENPLTDIIEIQEYREKFSNTQDNYLEEKSKDEEFKKQVIFASHRKSENRVSLNQIVTVGTDFTFTINNNIVTIYAGQVGKISKILKNDLVEVSFKSAFLNQLISEIETSSVNKMDSFNNCFAKIIIHKDYLFYLYYQNLDNSGDRLYYQDLQRKWGEDDKFMEQFDPNTCFDSNSCFKVDQYDNT